MLRTWAFHRLHLHTHHSLQWGTLREQERMGRGERGLRGGLRGGGGGEGREVHVYMNGGDVQGC